MEINNIIASGSQFGIDGYSHINYRTRGYLEKLKRCNEC